MPLKIGLTGGVASGKSTVAGLFERRGVPVLDADTVVHELLADDAEVIEAIAGHFGPDVIGAHGVDHVALREHVFRDTEQRRWLEALLHPRVRSRMLAWSEAQEAPYVLLVVPLLVEAGWQDLVDRVLLVEAPRALRRERLLQRPGMDPATADAIIAAQASDEARRAVADDLVLNEAGLEALERAVGALHHGYLEMAASQ